jgi:type I restriction enzyme S subunit
MSRYKPYPAYKDSGVEWLGGIPASWHVTRLKHCFRLITNKTDRRERPVGLENIESWSGRFRESDTEFEGEGIAFNTGDILFGKLRPYLAKVYLAAAPGEAVGDFHVLRHDSSTVGRFAQYQMLTRDFVDVVDSSTFGARMPRVSWEFLGAMGFTVPSTDEQVAIAAFLDRETAKLDALIAKQERLIALLQEKRQALISHAVTKGLNPNAPMKDSGIEWLGQVPAHWSVTPLGAVCGLIQTGPFGSQLHAEDYITDGVPVVNPSNLEDGQIQADWRCTVSAVIAGVLSQHLLCYGDIVVARRGEMGRCAVVDLHAAGWLCGTGSMILRLKTGQPRFVSTYLGTSIARETLRLESVGSTMDNLNSCILGRLRIPFPPDEQQREIVEHLQGKTSALVAAIDKSRRSIDLLREHRTALISAAVTGKIDVRDAA